MAVGEFSLPSLFPVAGVKLGVAAAGIKYQGRNDCVLIEFAQGSRVAGVFTQNAFCAAPVTLCKKNLNKNPRYFLVNSGTANACTGEEGLLAAEQTIAAVAARGGVLSTAVLPFSTGVIGQLLPSKKIIAAVPGLFADLEPNHWEKAARAIMTTDTRPKLASRKINLAGVEVAITGMAKGAGMIKPNMATMLAYIATDAAVAQGVLDELSRKAANRSFNRISIDGDTSTNDSCMLVATAKAGNPEIREGSGEAYSALEAAITEIYQSLAQQIIRDGEGATKFVTINVTGGASADECLKVAYAIAHSPLVKTALFASDPNWGRIVAAVGYAGVENLKAAGVRVCIDDVLIVENGGKAASYTEEAGQSIFNKAEFSINVDLGRGSSSETLWTSDLSHEYVTINAEYRT